ncbi:MAG: tryptophan 2,3-dioxygenase family protein [Bacteroidota bacterium]
MSKREVEPEIKDQLNKLKAKYEAMGQDLSSYLDGLLYSDFLTYWDYIHLDTLLSLQTPRTDIPDEKIFILYHQTTELYFKMILNEVEQLVYTDPIDHTLFKRRLRRINRYLNHLISSFDVMIDGMDREQFLAFRMALLPASGFQSAQYRLIEIYSTDFINLVNREKRKKFRENDSIEQMYEHIYWKSGATELASKKKTLTLRQFEAKYGQQFTDLANKTRNINIVSKFRNYYQNNDEIKDELRTFDEKANVEWPLQHLKSAATYLQQDPHVLKATGGTNWQKYLPPKNQGIVFYPELWNASEIENWGKRFRKAFSM